MKKTLASLVLAGALAFGVAGCDNSKETKQAERNFTYVNTLLDENDDFTSYTSDKNGKMMRAVSYIDLDNDFKTVEVLVIIGQKSSDILVSPNLTHYDGCVGLPKREMTEEESRNADAQYKSIVNGAKTKEGFRAGFIEIGKF